ASELRSALLRTLPDYMVPSSFVVLEKLPLTANGKLDVRALPDPEVVGEGAYRAPVTPTEVLLFDLYAELTGASRVGLEESFFALGGHSLLAMRLVARVREALGIDLPLRVLFERPQVESLAQQLRGDHELDQYSPIVDLNSIRNNQILFCVHPAGGLTTIFNNLAQYLEGDLSVVGLQARGLEGNQKPFETASEMIDCYEEAIWAYKDFKSCYLVGYSAGAAIAHELASRLERRGKTIELFGILDGAVPGSLSTKKDQTRLETLQDFLIDDIKNVKNITDYDWLFQRAVNLMINKYAPEGTPAEFANRILEEMILSVSRMNSLVLGKGSFDAVYFAADADPASQKMLKAREQWQEHCRSVTYISVEATHAKLLDIEPSQFIASYIRKHLIK
ncbi:MAG: thioesterase domain-containing protein, partial [Methylocystis sp.]